MKRIAPVLLILSMVSVALGGEAIIAVPEVEVRSGPSPAFYATGKLRQGDRVDVVGEPQSGYLKIAPPAGSFSLILKTSVDARAGNVGVVIVDGAETLVGGSAGTPNVRGTRLERGSGVKILGEVTLPGGPAPLSYYQITPLNEVRYIPADAIRKQEIIQTSGSSGGQASHLSPEVAGLKQRAELAYQQAETTGDWTAARQLYEELAKCPDHDCRMEAWNRLEYIRKRMAYPAARRPQPPSMRASSSYTYATDNRSSSAGRLAPTPQPPVAPASRSRPNVDANTSQARYVPESPTAKGPAMYVGRLVRSSRTDPGGRPLYMLIDSMGGLRCYVMPGPGKSLEGWLERSVEIQGEGLTYRADLRGNVVTATDIRPLY
jgi:hypothetical protein